MVASSGRRIQLEWGGQSVKGVREKGITLNGEPIDITNDDSESWRELLSDDPAENQVTISLSGVTRSFALKRDWFNNDRQKFLEIVFEDDSLLTGYFVLTNYVDTGPYNDATTFEATLESTVIEQIGFIEFVEFIGGGAPFDPLSMFEGGKLGAWYYIPTLAEQLESPILFQDSAGNTPVTAYDQTVKRVLDRSPNASHWVNSHASNNVVYQLGYNGKPCLRCPSGGFLSTANNKTLTPPTYMVSAIEHEQEDAFTLFGMGVDNANGLFITNLTNNSRMEISLRKTSTSTVALAMRAGTGSLNMPHIIDALMVGNVMTSWINGGHTEITDPTDSAGGHRQEATVWNGVSLANCRYGLCNNGGLAGTLGICKFYGGIILHAEPTEEQRVDTHNYYKGITGFSVLEDQNYDMFLFVGQSNMQGGKGNRATSTVVPFNEAVEFIDAGYIKPVADPTQHEAPGDFSLTGSSIPACAKEYFNLTGKRMCSVGAARSGRGIFSPASPDNWGVTGTHVGLAVAKLNAAKTYLGNKGTIKGVVWLGGEQDALTVLNLATYKAALVALRDNFRTQTGIPSLPLLLMSIDDKADDRTDYALIRRALSEAAAENEGISLVMPYQNFLSQGKLDVDGIHWNQVALNEGGALAANGIVDAIGGFLPDFVVDAALGNDSNPGTAAAPWASLNKINSIPLVSGAMTKVLIKTGTYNKISDFITITAGSGVSNCRMDVRFEPGCSIDGINYSGTNGIELIGTAGNYSNIFRFYGNGCTIRNVLTASGNGLGGTNGGWVYFYDFDVRNCVDCSTAHGDLKVQYTRCFFGDATKSPSANIQTSENRYIQCTISDENNTAISGGLIIVSNTPTNYFQDCIILPGTTGNHRTIGSGGGLGHICNFIRCQVGTLTRSVSILLATYSFTKSYLNLQGDTNSAITVTMSFSKLSMRLRSGGSLTMNKNVIVGAATGYTNVIYDFGGSGVSVTLMKDNIFKMGATFMAIDATNAGLLAGNGSQFYNNILNGGAVYDADLVAAAADIQNTLTSDPLIGAANTVLMADYAYGTGSPAIGSGTSGGNRGFGAGDVEERIAA